MSTVSFFFIKIGRQVQINPQLFDERSDPDRPLTLFRLFYITANERFHHLGQICIMQSCGLFGFMQQNTINL